MASLLLRAHKNVDLLSTPKGKLRGKQGEIGNLARGKRAAAGARFEGKTRRKPDDLGERLGEIFWKQTRQGQIQGKQGEELGQI